MGLHSLGYVRYAVLASAIVLGAEPSSALAQDNQLRCSLPEDEISRSRHFAELQIKALELDRDVCLNLGFGTVDESSMDQQDRYMAFGIDAKRAAEAALGDLPIEHFEVPFDSFIDQISVGSATARRFPELNVELSDRSDQWLKFHFDDPVEAAHCGMGWRELVG